MRGADGDLKPVQVRGLQPQSVTLDRMVRVAIVCKPHKEELGRLLPELIAWLRQHDFDPTLDREGGEYTGSAPALDRAEMPALKPELVIVLGGDGTLLAAARVFASSGTPILSVNLGYLGFLTEVRLADLYSTLESWCDGCHELDERAMLHASLWREGAEHSCYEALNEVVVSKGDIARMGEFAVELDGKKRGPVPRRRRHRLHSHRLHGLHSGGQWAHSDAGCGCDGGDAHLPAPAHAAPDRGARRRVAHRARRGDSEPGAAYRRWPAGRRAAIAATSCAATGRSIQSSWCGETRAASLRPCAAS